MIALVAPAVFGHVEHERYTVNLDTIDGYSMKYSVIHIPHANDHSRIVGEVLEKHSPIPVPGKIDFVLQGKAGEPLELTRVFGDKPGTVKTPYTSNKDVAGHGTMHFHAYLKASGMTYVCNL